MSMYSMRHGRPKKKLLLPTHNKSWIHHWL